MTVWNADVEALLARSHRLGADPRVTNYAGGNTSVKTFVEHPGAGSVDGPSLAYAGTAACGAWMSAGRDGQIDGPQPAETDPRQDGAVSQPAVVTIGTPARRGLP